MFTPSTWTRPVAVAVSSTPSSTGRVLRLHQGQPVRDRKDALNVSLEDAELLAEVELLADLMAAAEAQSARFTPRQVDALLRVTLGSPGGAPDSP